MNPFRTPNSFTTVNHLKDLPDTPQKSHLSDSSNAGKIQRDQYPDQPCPARLRPKTPGRTQHINFFELSNGSFMVDLPGYGYAQVPEAIRTHWVKLLGDYLQQRCQLIPAGV